MRSKCAFEFVGSEGFAVIEGKAPYVGGNRSGRSDGGEFVERAVDLVVMTTLPITYSAPESDSVPAETGVKMYSFPSPEYDPAFPSMCV